MKAKNINKKLSLNRQTVVHLDQEDMKRLNGGLPWTETCPPTYSCPTTTRLCLP